MTSSQADSRVVLDMNGAEKLVGHGDMLFAPASSRSPSGCRAPGSPSRRSKASPTSSAGQREVVYDHVVEGLGLPPTEAERRGGGDHALGSDDDLLEQAAELVIRSQLGSTSMLQRKLKVGFARAGRLMDLLEEQGIVGPSPGSKARDVLVTPEEWEERRSACGSACATERADATRDLEHRVGVLLGIDHDRPRRADLRLPVAVDRSWLQPRARALSGSGPSRSRARSASGATRNPPRVPSIESQNAPIKPQRVVVEPPEIKQEPDGSLGERVGRDDPVAQRGEREQVVVPDAPVFRLHLDVRPSPGHDLAPPGGW